MSVFGAWPTPDASLLVSFVADGAVIPLGLRVGRGLERRLVRWRRGAVDDRSA